MGDRGERALLRRSLERDSRICRCASASCLCSASTISIGSRPLGDFPAVFCGVTLEVPARGVHEDVLGRGGEIEGIDGPGAAGVWACSEVFERGPGVVDSLAADWRSLSRGDKRRGRAAEREGAGDGASFGLEEGEGRRASSGSLLMTFLLWSAPIQDWKRSWKVFAVTKPTKFRLAATASAPRRISLTISRDFDFSLLSRETVPARSEEHGSHRSGSHNRSSESMQGAWRRQRWSFHCSFFLAQSLHFSRDEEELERDLIWKEGERAW